VYLEDRGFALVKLEFVRQKIMDGPNSGTLEKKSWSETLEEIEREREAHTHRAI